ncbi:MAG: glucosyl-3-phosphoglycerate synthase [Solirubrobacteraceae bacterium]|jgi:glycosyltransferase involved in cell wall biosynthesis|nr:glucosyl-3-phosphoglycerate synthase [Solirubrobacteraceae bacterium]
MFGPLAIVVVPALDEAERIEACIRALGAQDLTGEFSVLLVDDGCRDATVALAKAAAAACALPLEILSGPGHGPGPARQVGLDVAAQRMLAGGRPDGLVATTDADTRVPPNWLSVQIGLLDGGADAVGGWIDLDPEEAAGVPAHRLALREDRASERLAAVRRVEPDAEHHHFAGASIGMRARTYAGLACSLPVDLEDALLAEMLHAAGARIARSRAVAVVTSARTAGRARRGLSADLAGHHPDMERQVPRGRAHV